MAKQDRSPAPEVDANGLPDFSGWSVEQVGFAPYWQPKAGAWFYATPIAKDERDVKFVRYLMIAHAPTPCARGAVDDAEPVTVKPGEVFTCSAYYGLSDLLEFYMGTGELIKVRVESKELREKVTRDGNDLWSWEIKVSPEQRKMLDRKRLEMGIMPGTNLPIPQLGASRPAAT